MSSLGDTLAEERRRQGKTIVEAEAATRVRGRMLEALEHGNYDMLPSTAYVKGYIQSYAKYLDIPAEPLLEMYRAEMRFAEEANPETDLMPKMPRGADRSSASRQSLEGLANVAVEPRDRQHAIPTRTWLLVAGGIAAVLLVIWGISALSRPESAVTPVPPPVGETSSTASTGTRGATGTPPAASAAPTQPPPSFETTPAAPVTKPFVVKVRAVAGQSSGVKVTADGAVVFDGTISDGAVKQFPVQREAVVVIGKPRYVVTYKDATRIPTPNTSSPYTLTVKGTP